MTKQQLIDGVIFTMPNNNTLAYKMCGGSTESAYIGHFMVMNDGVSVNRFSSHECNVEAVGSKLLSVYTFVMGVRIQKVFRIEDLTPFLEEDRE
mgnify:CR=1 FL=1